jgi:hypothetical protein
LYPSDGPSRQYGIGATGQQVLVFRQSALKDTGLNLRESGLLVQALKVLGKDHADAMVIETLRQWLDPNLRARVLRDTRMVTGWIYEIIKQVCQENREPA